MTISSTKPRLSPIRINQGKIDAFLVAAEGDRPISDRIHESLMREGLTVWEQPNYLRETALKDNGLEGIAKARVIVYLVSPSSEQSPMCQEELAQALDDKKPIIPVIIDKTVLKSFLPPVLRAPWVDLTNFEDEAKYAIGIKKLVKVLQHPNPTVASSHPSIRQRPRYTEVQTAFLVIALIFGLGGLTWGGMTWFNQVNTDRQEAIATANQAKAEAAAALTREQKALKEAKDAKINLSIVMGREKAAKAQAAAALTREQKALKLAKDAKTNLSIVIAREQKALKEAKDAKKNLSIVIAREKAAIEQTNGAEAQLNQAKTQLTQTKAELNRANDQYFQAQINLREAVNRANQAEEALRNYEAVNGPVLQ